MREPRPSFWKRFRASLSDPIGELMIAFLVILLIIAAGTIGYMVLEGWSWDEALYMTVITVATVGYGEVRPLDSSGRAFTIVLIILGVGAMAWAFTRAFEVTLGEAFWSSVRKQRMKERISRLSGHHIVCGYGRLGRRIVMDLAARGEPYVVIDWGSDSEAELQRDQIPTCTATPPATMSSRRLE